MTHILRESFQMKLNPKNFNLTNKKRSFDYGLEGLRGLAAVWVVYGHATGFENQLDPTYHPVKNPLFFLHASHGAVLIFFVLSGYVIGLTNTSTFSYARAKQYLIRRIVRLWPIYIVAIVISSFFSANGSTTNILGNLFFLQGVTVPILSGNTILWTLNYEIIYYLLFLFIWRYRPNPLLLILCACATGLIGWLSPNFPQLVSGYAVGWIFWLAGLWLAWRVPQARMKRQVPLFSYLCILIATNHFSTGKVILNGLGFSNPEAAIINLSDFALLPICILLIACITQRFFVGLFWVRMMAFLLPLSTFIVLVLKGRLLENISWSTSSLFLVVALVSSKILLRPDWLRKLSYLGSISYGIYIFHMPAMHLIHSSWFPFVGTPTSFGLRILCWLLLVVGFSHIMERKFQPRVKFWFKRHNLA